MGIGPIYAVPRLLERHGLKVSDIGLWELNEAFASQCLYSRDKLGIDPATYNVNGGAISIGHPYGMTGARCVGVGSGPRCRRSSARSTGWSR
jgi:acetyl-CoA C-acetyltransferase